MPRFIYCSLWFCLSFFKAQSQAMIELSPRQTQYELIQQAEVVDDTNRTISLQKLLNSNLFRPFQKASFNFGYTTHRYWIRFRFWKKAPQQQWILAVRGTLIDQIDLYLIPQHGKPIHKVSGDNLPFSQREIACPTFAFYLDTPSEPTEAYLAVTSDDPIQFMLSIQEANYFHQNVENETRVWFFYFGMLFMIGFYNLLLFVSIRDLSILFYVLYILCFLVINATMLGYGTMLVWGESAWFTKRASFVGVGFTNVFFNLFAYYFLNIRQLYPKIVWMFQLCIVFGAFIVLIGLTYPSVALHRFMAAFIIPNTLFVFLMSFWVWKQGYRPARYYLIGWSTLLLAIIIFMLKTANLIPLNYLTFLSLPVSGVLEATLLSLGIGDRIKTAQKEKANAQQKLLLQQIDNERIRINIARDLHDDLGSTVSSIAILSQFAESQLKQNPTQIPELLNRLSQNAQKMQETMQDIVWTNQPEHDTLSDLSARMRRFGGELLESKGILFSLDIADSLLDSKLPPHTQYDFFMIFKEAVNNAAKYSCAGHVNASIWLDNQTIRLRINDDGIGFDLNAHSDGNGLRNMTKRAEQIGGTLHINTQPDTGTQILLAIPIP
ncbi:MAG: 7TM diverse intracellular signaling domain-containing protein [Spirosomataceae bacterium]